MKKPYQLTALLIMTVSMLQAQDTTDSCQYNVNGEAINSVLNVFPNPTAGSFQISYASTTSCPPVGWGGIFTLNIINAHSQVVYTETILKFDGVYQNTVDLSSYEKGVYLVEVISGMQRFLKREVLN